MEARLFIVSRLPLRACLGRISFIDFQVPQVKGKIDHHASFGMTLTGTEPSQMIINAFSLIEIYFCEKSNGSLRRKRRDYVH